MLLGLFVWSLPRMVTLPRLMLRRPYVTFALTYTLGFVIAFANIGNFGILARQRSQLLPLFAVLLCLPPVRRALAPAPAAARDEAATGDRHPVPAGQA